MFVLMPPGFCGAIPMAVADFFGLLFVGPAFIEAIAVDFYVF
jgi:hypothetical protein